MDTKKYLLVFVLGIFLISFVSASMNWDNVKASYDQEKQEIKIVNGLNFPLINYEIANVKLNTPTIYNVIRGKDRLVAEFTIENLNDYDNVFNNLEFYDLKNSNQKIERQFVYKIKEISYVDVADYEKVCSPAKNNSNTCLWVENGTKKEERVNWKILNDKEVLLKGNVTIGVFTDVGSNEKIEWIPTLYGVKIKEWAIWIESLENGLLHWAEPNSTYNKMIDLVGLYNGTLTGGANIISGAPFGKEMIDLDGTTGMINFSDTDFPSGTNAITILIRVNTSGNLEGSAGLFGRGTNLDGGIRAYSSNGYDLYIAIAGDTNLYFNPMMVDKQFVDVVWMRNASGEYLFSSGVYRAQLVPSARSVLTGTFILGSDATGTSNFHGAISTFAVWNRGLNASDILYLNSTSLYYGLNAFPTITLNLPLNNTNFTVNSITFNCSGQDDDKVQNISLWLGGQRNYTLIDGADNFTSLQISRNIAEGKYNWTCSVDDNASQVSWGANRTFLIDISAPVINNAVNLTNLTTFTLPVNSTWNYTVSDAGVGLSACYYNTSDNSTPSFIPCNIASINSTWNTAGNKTLWYYANDTLDFENYKTINLTVTSIIVSQSESIDPAVEGMNITFNLSVDSSETAVITSYLWLNNSRYNPTNTINSSNNYNFSLTLNIPTGWGNKTGNIINWFWNYTITGIINNKSTDETNVTVYSVSLDNCSTNTIPILNISLRDEELNELVNNNDVNTSVIEIDLQLTSLFNKSLFWNFNETWNDVSNVSVCLPSNVLNSSNFTIDFTIGYESTSHVREFFYLDQGFLMNNNDSLNSLTNRTIDLMDLLTVDSTSFLFNYFDKDGLSVTDVIIHIFRKYIGEGIFREIERAKQDPEGDAVIHLVEEDAIYFFAISQNGSILFSSTTYIAKCLSMPCQIQIEEGGAFVEFPSDYDLIDNGGISLTSDYSTRIVNLTYTLTSSSTMNLTVYKFGGDGTYASIGSSQTTGSIGSLTVTVPQSSGNYSYFASIYQDGNFIKSEWIDMEEDAGLYFGNTLSLFLGFLIILALSLMAVSEGAGTILFLILGLIITSILGLIDYRTSFVGNLLIYLICAGGVVIWKISKRNR